MIREHSWGRSPRRSLGDHRASAYMTNELADADVWYGRWDKKREALILEHGAGAAAIAASNMHLRGELRKYVNENTSSSWIPT